MVQELRERIDKWDYMKVKSFFTTKEMVIRWGRPQNGRKSFWLYTWQEINNQKIRGTQKIKLSKINDPMKKWANELNKDFSKEEVQMVKYTWRNAQHHWLQRKCKSKPG
jgi:hypothetical protein